MGPRALVHALGIAAGATGVLSCQAMIGEATPEGEATAAAAARPGADPAPGPGGAAAGAGGGAAGGAGAPVACATPAYGPAPFRRLTRLEYNNTVRDLLGDTTQPARDFAADGLAGIFRGNADFPATPQIATDYLQAAEALAAAAVQRLDTLWPCRPSGAAAEEACARQFVSGFGKRAFRRPLEDADVARLLKVYAAARARGHDFAGGLRLVLTAILESPSFLHHVELGPRGAAADRGAVPLTQHEVAARLSYLIWRTMPDDRLTAAADAGRLGGPREIEAEAKRLLADPRARAGLALFYEQWLQLDKLDRLEKSAKMFPGYTTSWGRALRREMEAYVSHVLWDGDGKLGTLLTGSFGFVNATVARVYGLAGVTGDELRKVDMNPAERSGVMTLPGFMAAQAHEDQTSPVHRGLFVRKRLLCQETPSPPPEVNVSIPPPDPSLTTRQRYELHLKDAFCGACHRLMNPIGLAMETYDPLGQFRLRENGQPVDDSGEIVATGEIDGPFRGTPELVRKLAGARIVRACMAKQWFLFATGAADVKGPGGECSLARLAAETAASGGDLRDLVLAVVRSEGFRHRAPAAAPGEVCR
jgi:hypothetical protein